jgi:hypothetical protein
MQKTPRIDPKGSVQDYKTYQIISPLSSHWRPATCEEVNCKDFLNGWRVRVEGLPGDMLHLARTSGRKFTEVEESANSHWLVFESGQPCFRASEHRALLDKQEIFAVRDGDWRGNPTGKRRLHTRPEFWQEDFAEHQDQLARRIQQG